MTAPMVIVGGGPVGMTTALLLARFGLASVVLEASGRRDPVGSKALCMQRDVLDVLDRVGCAEPLVDEGVTWTLGRTYYRHQELFQITFSDQGRAHFPPFVNVGQDRTEFWLEKAVSEEPLVDLRYGHPVERIELAEDGVRVSFGGPEGGDAEGAYLIGADGAGSTTRKLLGIGFPGESFDDRFLICDIRADLGFAEERRFFFDPVWNPDRQVLIHPQADSVWRIDWQVPPDFDLEREQLSGALDERIRKITGEREYEIVWMSVYQFHQRLADTFRVGRAFLAGDAAHLMSPFGARGLNSGIQDAENLAWKLAFVERGWAPPELLDTYDIERRAAAAENLAITGATMDFLVPGDEQAWDHRRAALEEAVGNPRARELVDSGQLAEPFVYAASPLTKPAEVETTLVPGQLFPDAPVSREPGRFRPLLGNAVVVLSNVPIASVPTDAPVSVLAIDEIDAEGVLAAACGFDGPAAAVIRPDGHLAAVVPPERVPDAVAASLAA